MFGRRLEKLINAQHEEVMAQHEETMAYLRRREEEFKCLIEASERRSEETRDYNHEILLRNEKVYTSVIAQLEENTEETRAQTQGLLRLIDRFDQPGDAAAA